MLPSRTTRLRLVSFSLARISSFTPGPAGTLWRYLTFMLEVTPAVCIFRVMYHPAVSSSRVACIPPCRVFSQL